MRLHHLTEDEFDDVVNQPSTDDNDDFSTYSWILNSLSEIVLQRYGPNNLPNEETVLRRGVEWPMALQTDTNATLSAEWVLKDETGIFRPSREVLKHKKLVVADDNIVVFGCWFHCGDLGKTYIEGKLIPPKILADIKACIKRNIPPVYGAKCA